MRAIISAFGKDKIGILNDISSYCARYSANVIDVNQTIIEDYFAMFMIVDIDKLNIDFCKFIDEMNALGEIKNLKIHVMHEEIFNMMHKI